MHRAKFLLPLIALLVPLSITGIARPAQVAELEKLNICYSSIAATSMTTWVPQEAGIFKKYGLDVNIIYVAGAQAITTLISGRWNSSRRKGLSKNSIRADYDVQSSRSYHASRYKSGRKEACHEAT